MGRAGSGDLDSGPMSDPLAAAWGSPLPSLNQGMSLETRGLAQMTLEFCLLRCTGLQRMAHHWSSSTWGVS